MTGRPPAPPLPKPPHPAVTARALTETAHAAAFAWARPLEPDQYSRALSQLFSALRDLGIATRGLATYQTPTPTSSDFAEHVARSAQWLLDASESLSGVLADEGLGPVPDPDEPGAVLCRVARKAILSWRQPAGAAADRDITVKRFITATGFLSAATLSLAIYAPRRQAIDLQTVGAHLAEVTACLTAAIQAPDEEVPSESSPGSGGAE